MNIMDVYQSADILHVTQITGRFGVNLAAIEKPCVPSVLPEMLSLWVKTPALAR